MRKNCKISGDTAEQLIKGLARSLSVDYETDNNEYCFNIPEALGAGYFKGIQFSHGIHVLEFDIFLKQALKITFKKENLNPLRLVFNGDASIKHTNSGEVKDNKTVSKLQYILCSNGVSSVHKLSFNSFEHSSVFIININRKAFEEKIDTFSDCLSEDLAMIFKDLNGVNYVYHQDYFPLEISKIIEEFKACELDEFMKPVFLEGKAYEILTFQIQNYSDNLKGKNDKTLLRKSTIEKIEKALDIIKNELDIRINVHNLAKRAGLNQNTLQSGFKTLFKTSVNEYIKNYRLELAKTLIEKSDLNITEITYKIGISSRSYFSKLFKEKYGVSPNEYLNQMRKTKSA